MATDQQYINAAIDQCPQLPVDIEQGFKAVVHRFRINKLSDESHKSNLVSENGNSHGAVVRFTNAANPQSAISVTITEKLALKHDMRPWDLAEDEIPRFDVSEEPISRTR